MTRRPSPGPAAAVLLALAGAAAAADPATLYLVNGGRVPGEPRATDTPAVWRWRSSAFAVPLDFPAAAVRAVHYAVPPGPPRPAGGYAVEVGPDDSLSGDLLAVSDDAVELADTPVGRARLKRAAVRRVFRWAGGDAVYLGPNGLTGWAADPGNPGPGREEGGHLVLAGPENSLAADIGLPARAAVEVALSWAGPPDFSLALGAVPKDPAARAGFRLEVFGGQLVAVAESARAADLAVIGPAGPGPGRPGSGSTSTSRPGGSPCCRPAASRWPPWTWAARPRDRSARGPG